MKYDVKENGCWDFVGALLPNGYGKMGRKGKMWLAHRFSYTQSMGEIPEGLCVLHKCDNRKCVNPDHLFLGTRTDNMQDMIRKGRQDFSGLRTNGCAEKAARNAARGEAHPYCKHSDSTIKEIISLISNGMTQTRAAEIYGIRQGYISKIVNGVNRA